MASVVKKLMAETCDHTNVNISNAPNPWPAVFSRVLLAILTACLFIRRCASRPFFGEEITSKLNYVKFKGEL